MASALLASRIEPSWGDRKVYMKNYNSNNTPLYDNTSNHSLYPNPNPNPNSKSKQIHDSTSAHLHYRHDDDAAAAIDEETASFVPRTGPNRFIAAAEYVTFHLGGLSRSELRELKKRLISELEQVRSLRTRLEAAVFESRSAYPSSQFSATARPSPESPRRKDEVIGSSNSKPKGGTQKKGPLGSKRVNPYGSDKPEQLKKPALESHGMKDNQPMVSMMKKCASILSKLMKHKHGWVFNTPVDVVGLGLHDYRQIIKNPMDLGTVKSNLERDFYRSPKEFASDVRLTFDNALTYNPKGHDVHIMAEALLQQFNQMFDPAYRKCEKERQRAAAAVEFEEPRSKPRSAWVEESFPQSSRRDPEAMPIEKKSKPSPKVKPPPALSNQEEVVPARQTSETIAAPAPVPAPAPAPAPPPPGPGGKRVKTQKLPKPKAKDPNKREMSFEEKAKLGMNLQSLPPEKMGQLLHIIRKRNKHFAQDGDEIELDIEAVDTETLWELDRFVCNYKKLVSKIKRQGLINNQISASEITHKSPERESPEPIPQKGKKGETGGGEEDVDIGDEMPASDYPPVEIERDARSDSSSSSSSSSDSSSSDSDSQSSSSGSDSDADSVQSPFVGSKGGHGS